MLTTIQTKLGSLVKEDWSSVMDEQAQRVALYRDYEDGVHRADLTTEMQKMLRISERKSFDQFNMNYCGLVVEKMADRLQVLNIVAQMPDGGDNKKIQDYLDACRRLNRFDELQMDVHSCAIRDADTFLLVEYDNEKKFTRWVSEPAYDEASETGMIVVYDRMRRKIEVAVKIWDEADTKGQENKRVNFYYANRIEKYKTGAESGNLVPFADGDTDEKGVVWWTDNRKEGGKPLGVPVFHFRNNKKRNRAGGISELSMAIPLQDAINRTMVSMIMTAELTGFGMWFVKGLNPDAAVAPGKMIIADLIDEDGKDMVTSADDAEKWAKFLDSVDMKLLEQAQITPFLEQLAMLIDKLCEITRTPIPSQMGNGTQSGIALKERQTGLVEKAQRAQTIFGNVWEDIAAYSVMLHRVFGGAALAEAQSYQTQWQPAEMRQDGDIIAAAQIMQSAGYEEEFLRLMGKLPYLQYDEAKILNLVAEKSQRAMANIRQLGLPGFGSRASA